MNNSDYRSIILRRSYKFSLDIIELATAVSKGNMTHAILLDQLVRSGTSVGANLVEAQASTSRKDFSNFISHALKSANETRYWLSLLKDGYKIQNSLIDHVQREAIELANILGSSMIKLKLKNNFKLVT